MLNKHRLSLVNAGAGFRLDSHPALFLIACVVTRGELLDCSELQYPIGQTNIRTILEVLVFACPSLEQTVLFGAFTLKPVHCFFRVTSGF